MATVPILYIWRSKRNEKGVAVGQLWMKQKGWLLDDKAISTGRGKQILKDVQQYIDNKI